MVRTGFELAERILAFPSPVGDRVHGHAIAMGAFLVLRGDYRIGALGAYRIGANEVAIGSDAAGFGVEICRRALAPAHFSRAVRSPRCTRPKTRSARASSTALVPAPESCPPRAHRRDGSRSSTRTSRRDQAARAGHALEAIRAAIEADASAAFAL
jgi:enoyl-CoA hydratase